VLRLSLVLYPNSDGPMCIVAEAFMILYDAIVEGTNPALGHGREGYYFTTSGEHSYYDIGEAIGSALVKLGKSKTSEPTTFTQDEVDKYFQGVSLCI